MKDGIDHSKAGGLIASNIAAADAALFEACKKGDEAAWDSLVDRYQRLIYAIPRRAGLSEEQCADVFQEVFLTFVQKIDEIEQPERIRSWLVSTAKFKTWGVIRTRKGIYSAIGEEEYETEIQNLADSSPLAESVLIELEQQHLIRRAVNDLDERCRKILSMIYLADTAASYATVAEAIGVGETSISPLRSRCLKKLEKMLSN
ncbi:MAG TPA: sigma-70 family RNA polymerase sigma factor [Pyrinomonadaceae bacterium]|nr:sigma-70 family RNA polymerase sigma factor [Chloracidobacterium sp.]HBE82697.1 hypothetical protein [Blastocatellia bacterium]HRJ89592.1 sigma-70 family RNA polymerase sigma factor [Pyrinomonadaceae bacterium]HRK49597.1 sigma-70 family RNA polymerase sigma factor [Pyrinomonadaceae bacterium]